MATDYLPRDFVYAGKRQGTKSIFAIVFLLKDDGTLEDDYLAYDAKVLKGRSVGTVYTGAEFGPDGAKNMAHVQYKGRLPNKALVMAWEAKNDELEARLRSEKLEKDAAKVSEIEKAMLPLRKAYADAGRRGDWASKEALEAAVMRALRIPPRSHE